MGAVEDAVAHVCGSFFEYGVAVLAIFLLIVLIQRPKNLPPGPTGLPIIGALHLLGQRPHETLARMADKYGPLMSLYMGQQLCIVASSRDTAMEFLKRQDAVFCSRPPQRGFEVIFPKDITFSDITPASRHLRKILHSQLTSGRRIEEAEHIRADEIAQTVRSIAPGLVDLKVRLAVMTANILTRLIISKRFMGRSGMNSTEEKELQDFVDITEEIGDCLGTANPRDVIPAFKCIDILGLGLDRRFTNLRRHMESFLSKIIAERRQNSKLPEKDLLDVLLEQLDHHEITEDVVISIIWEAFAAGMETTVLATEWTMAEVLRSPQIQAQAQAELDDVVGHSRPVQESDLPNLKYIRAIVKESFRLHPIIPLLIPHHSSHACSACGYHIPAHTNLLVNVWAIGRDPSVFTNPLEFQPERFLPEGPHAGTEWTKGFDLLIFGFGRRACMGMSLGALLVETSVASLLHSFSWSPPPDGIDMTEGSGLSVRKAVPLTAIATARLPTPVY
uniref:Flavonoid 3',5'-hydroxylase n=1 Tax=Pohlia nutans TaxID=140635 RepID=W5XK05_9BRYO|nr:flavonoid 3',5'-hydroxylase [Pohlia nutans]